MLLDLVLDPLAVDEKRWNWELPYLLWNPYFKLFGWLLVPLLILLVFQQCSYQVTKVISSYSVLFQYAPGILFIFYRL